MGPNGQSNIMVSVSEEGCTKSKPQDAARMRLNLSQNIFALCRTSTLCPVDVPKMFQTELFLTVYVTSSPVEIHVHIKLTQHLDDESPTQVVHPHTFFCLLP